MPDFPLSELRATRDSVLRKKVTLAQKRLRLLQILERIDAQDVVLMEQLRDVEDMIEEFNF